MPINRHKRERDYTILPNDLLRDERLELRDVGLLCFCLSLPSDWHFSVSGLCAVLHTGRDGIKASLRRLEQAGYLMRSQQRDKYGKLSGCEWTFTDQPQTGFPLTAQPSAASPTRTNYLSNQKNYGNKGESFHEFRSNYRRASTESDAESDARWGIVYDA